MLKTPKSSKTTSLPKMCFHKATNQFYVRLSGNLTYLGSDHTAAERRYHRAISEWLSRGRQPAPPSIHEITVAEIASRYLIHCKEYYAQCPENLSGIKRAMDGLVNYLDTPAAEFGALALQTIREGFIAQNLTRKYINRLTGYITRMFRWAGSQELVDAAVFTRLITVQGLRVGFCTARENTVRQPVEESEILEVLPHLSKVVGTALQVLFLTGARPSELLTLRPCDIDRTRPEVWIATLDKHKNSHRGKSRSLIFGPKAIQLLTPFMLRPADKPLFSPAEGMAEMRIRRGASRQTPLCCGNVVGSNLKDHPKIAPGEFYKPTAFNRAIRAGIEKANEERRKQAKQAGIEKDPPLLRNFFPYLCRHAAATRIRGIAGLDAAASVLGHANASTTAEHYAKLSLETAISVMTKIG